MDTTGPLPSSASSRPVWYRSFYWRIAASFAALVVLVLVGQSAIVSAVLTRRGGEFAPGDPNREATTVAARVREALRRDDAAYRRRERPDPGAHAEARHEDEREHREEECLQLPHAYFPRGLSAQSGVSRSFGTTS